MKLALAAVVLVGTCVGAHSQSRHPCADDAIAKAAPLLKLHFDQAERLENDAIRKDVKVLPPIRARKGKKLDVLEVWGYIYKSDYRMRFIYAQGCILVGQEILEAAVIPR